MDQAAMKLVQAIREDDQLARFANRLAGWLAGGLGNAAPITESRARALLRTADALDEPTLQSFARLSQSPAAVRVALYDLLTAAGLGDNNDVAALAHLPGESDGRVSWLALIVAAFAWKSGYPAQQLDPAAPPNPDSPAGQVIKRAAHYVRQQVQRGATERDKLARRLSQPPADAPTLEQLRPPDSPIAPLPPSYRPPVPVRYAEVARDTVSVEPETLPDPPPAVTRGEPLVISADDLPPAEPRPAPTTNPPISISHTPLPAERARPPRPLPRSAVLMPNSAIESRPSLSVAVRQMLGQEPMKTTRLRVRVQQYPDGPGLYGLQVRVTCPGIRSYVAGATDREGGFLCELPVRLNSGLTYDVDVTWPRDQGGEVERKSITLNADRTEFSLPFYRRSAP